MAGAGDKDGERNLVSELARRWASQRLTAVQAYGRILADYGSGRSTSTAAAGALAKLAAEEAVRYPADALALASDAAAALLRGGAQAATSAASQASGFRQATPPSAPMQDLELMGPLGGAAAAELLLRNPHDRAVALSFATSDFTGPAGETAASVRLDPAEFTLPPGGEQLILVSAQLDPEAFAPGGPYLANVAIAGFDDMVVRVRLMVLDPA